MVQSCFPSSADGEQSPLVDHMHMYMHTQYGSLQQPVMDAQSIL